MEDQEQSISDLGDIIGVLHVKPEDGFMENATKIHCAMVKIHMKKRDKGSISSAKKYNTLKGRWFTKETKEEKNSPD